MNHKPSDLPVKFPRKCVRMAWSLAALAIVGPLAGAQQGDSLLVGPGVSRALAMARSATIHDVRYDLRLDLTASDSAAGIVAIDFERTGTGDVILDFRGRRLTSVSVNALPLPTPDYNGHHLRIPAAELRSGHNSVRLSFVSDIAASGASIIRTRDAVDGATYLYTLLVPADANQLFPCFDQPDLKARVSLTLRAPRDWRVVANGSVAGADTVGAAVTTRFTETRPLSTYLIAFAAGPWREYASTARGRAVHLYTRASRAGEVDADTLLRLSHRALDWMEGYFGRPYPFEKFDLLLAPAFPFGGMEHPGLVMYNEDRFVFRDRPTLARRVGRFSTILHETAHQWFGDLVTMQWFDDLWLKEGFATYMGAKALAELEPQADAWKSFFQSNKPAAYGVDETLGTTPLWQELGNLDQAKSAYGAIVYNKAPAVLKQLNYLVGEDAFRAGIRAFLASHAYGNATWKDLLAAIGASAGRPLNGFGTNYMLRAGMPVVTPEMESDGNRLTRFRLRQQPAQPTVSGLSPWPIRTRVLVMGRDGRADRIDVDITDTVVDVPALRGLPVPQFIFPNAEDYGYFLAMLDSASVVALEDGAIGRVSDPLLRTMLWGALWDQVREARLDPLRFVRLALRELPKETDEQIVPALTGRLDRAIRAYLSDSVVRSVRPDAERVLWNGIADTARGFGVRRGLLDAYVSIAGSAAGRDRLVEVFHADSVVGEPVRDPTRWSIVTRLLVLGDPRADTLLRTQTARDTTPDGRRRAFTTAAGRPRRDTKAAYFRRYFADSTLNEDWATGSLGEFNAVEHEGLTLPFLRPALDSLPYIQQHRRIFFLGSWLSAFLNGQRSPEAARIVHDWLDARPDLPIDLRRKVLQSVDELDRTVRIRNRGNVRTGGPR